MKSGLSRAAVSAAALAVLLLLSGCRVADVVLEGASGARFVRNDRGVVVIAETEDGIWLFDLVTRRTLWRRPAKKYTAVTSSPRGGHLAIAEQDSISQDHAIVSVLRTSDGATLHARTFTYETSYNRSAYVLDEGHFVTSDDGALLAAAHDFGLEVFETEGGRRVFHAPSAARSIAFEPGARRLAVYGSDGTIFVVAPGKDGWREGALLKDAYWPFWVRGGLTFASPHGVEHWDGTSCGSGNEHARRA